MNGSKPFDVGPIPTAPAKQKEKMMTNETYVDVDRLEKKLNGLSPNKARNLLKKEGVLDNEGRLTNYGEHILGRMASKATNHAE